MAETPADLINLVQQAQQPERTEAGPGEVGPTTNITQPGTQLVTLPFDEAFMTQMWEVVKQSDQRVDNRAQNWDILLSEYLPIVKKGAQEVKSSGHFRNVHTKIGQLFYRSPDLVLEPDDPGPATNTMPNPMAAMTPPGMPPPPPLKLEDIIAVKQAVLKKKLGRDGIKGGRLMDELLFDVLAWAGIGCCKIGYRCVHKPIQRPVMGPDPNYQAPRQGPLGLSPQMPPPMVPQIGPDGQPLMETVPVPIYKEWYGRRFSPKKLITNADLYSTRFQEDSTLLGMHFYLSPARAMKDLNLTEAEVSKACEDDKRHKYDQDASTSMKLVHGVELWVKLSCYTDELHPLAVGQLILIEGIQDRPIVWRPSPDQEFDQMGQLTPDSLDTLPIKVMTLRDLADSCFPESDSAFTNGAIKEMSTWKRQSVKMRDANIGKFLVEAGKFDDTELIKLKEGEVGEHIIVADGTLKEGVDKVIAQTALLRQSPDDWRAQELMQREIDQTLGIGANQSGSPESTVRSATETATVNQAVAQRNDKELNRAVDFYLDVARALDQLLMRYATENEWVQLAGTEGARRMQVWNAKLISMKCLYDIAPDSQLRIDTAMDFTMGLKLYNIAAKDPLFNRAYVLRRLARMRGWDPAKVIMDPAQMMLQPPHGGPGQGASAGPQQGHSPAPVGPGKPGSPVGSGTPVSAHLDSNSGKRPNEPGAINHREVLS